MSITLLEAFLLLIVWFNRLPRRTDESVSILVQDSWLVESLSVSKDSLVMNAVGVPYAPPLEFDETSPVGVSHREMDSCEIPVPGNALGGSYRFLKFVKKRSFL